MIIVFFIIGLVIGIPIVIAQINYEDTKNMINDEVNDDIIDELNDEVTPLESEIIAQEKLVEMYYQMYLHECEKFREIPDYKKETDYYFKQWKKMTEAEARHIKAEARLAKLKDKANINYVISL